MLGWGCGRKETGILRWEGTGTRTEILVGEQCSWGGAGVMTKIGILEWSGGYWAPNKGLYPQSPPSESSPRRQFPLSWDWLNKAIAGPAPRAASGAP